jgi:hypothetical protein
LAIKPTKIEQLPFIVDKLNIDVIQFDPEFALTQVANKLKECCRRGIQFELCYGKSINSKFEYLDLISQLKKFLKVTNGKSLVLSNGTRDFSSYRSPSDIANMFEN